MSNNPSSQTLITISTNNSDQFPLIRTSSFSKLNAKAPEFVPMKPSSVPSPSPSPPPSLIHVYPPVVPVQLPVRGHHTYHYHSSPSPSPSPSPPHYSGEVRYRKKQTGKEEFSEKDQLSRSNSNGNGYGYGGVCSGNNNGLSDEAAQKLINQVEYYFSDVNLATTDHLIKFIFKDPEGFVPISVVSSFKKIKALISSNSQLAAILRNSTKLEVSEDGKKVKRVHRLASSDMEELQARIIVAENLPDDHCHQNLMKIFSVIGSVKSIRTCQPQPTNNAASSASRSAKTDNYNYNNKLHAFVEYETVELAEKAIAELNAGDNWRNGLRVRSLLKQAMKPVQGRAKKAGNEGEVNCEEVSVSTSEPNQYEKSPEHYTSDFGAQSPEHGDEPSLDKDGSQKKNRNRTKGKGRGRGHSNNHHHQNNRGSHVTSNGEPPVVAKQPPGPRMPDGTKGFSMGRGKPLPVTTT